MLILVNFFLIIYYFVLDILLVGKNAANGLSVNQHNVFNKDTFLHRFSLAYIFDILNGACLIFAVTGNVLEKFCFLQMMFLNCIFKFLYER